MIFVISTPESTSTSGFFLVKEEIFFHDTRGDRTHKDRQGRFSRNKVEKSNQGPVLIQT